MLNQAHFIGRLGKDPEIDESNATIYAWLSIANNRTWTDKGGNKREEVTWIDVVAFNGLAKTLRPLAKGDRVTVTGRLNNKRRSDGKIRGLEVVATQAS